MRAYPQVAKSHRRAARLHTLLPLLGILAAARAEAQWSPNPAVNNPVAVATDVQSLPIVVSDVTSGQIFTWVSARFDPPTSSTVYDLYAQRIDGNGVLQWGTGGVPIVTGTVSMAGAPQVRPFAAVSNPYPYLGIIVAWRDTRNSSDGDIYAQKLSVNGIPQWVVGGMPVSNGFGVQRDPALVADGEDGAIVAWEDLRAGPGNSDIYAQRLSPSGLPLWIATGMPVCDAPGDQALPVIVNTQFTGNLGAYIAWTDSRGADRDIYAQWLSSAGGRQWTLNGVVVSAAPGDQVRPVLNGSGPSLAWEDYRNGGDSDIYAQRLSPSGQQQWTSDGVQVASTANASAPAIAVESGFGGLYVAWQDERNGASNVDVFAQRVNVSGVPEWQVNGIAVSAAPGSQLAPAAAVPFSDFGLAVAWEDRRSGTGDIYAQRLQTSGAIAWTPDGVPVSVVPNAQRRVRIVPAATPSQPGLTVMVWEDDRNPGTGTDIYASRVAPNGTLPVLLQGFSVE